MKLFSCQVCAQLLFFENISCEKCGHRLGYDPSARDLMALDPVGEAEWRAAGRSEPQRWRFCANAVYGVCNWLVPAECADAFCLSCRHNRIIPDLSVPAHLTLWARVEDAKHRLIDTLLALRLPLPARPMDPSGLTFDILADQPGVPPPMTGHDNGLITLNLAEADDGEREKRRSAMAETYRTLLGHVRHEVGHFYWDRLVRDDDGALSAFRALFGDDRADYGEALQRHYVQGPAPDWRMHFVSAYASAHPWEDFAETFSHYLHIVDTLATARAFGLQVHPQVHVAGDLSAEIDFDPFRMRDIDPLIDKWLPLCFAVNALNRSMGQPDLYPFILSRETIQKLAFVQRIVQDRRGDAPSGASKSEVGA